MWPANDLQWERERDSRPRDDSMYCYGVSLKTISKMETGGANQEQIDYALATHNSTDPRDVIHHRAMINQYNPSDPWRQPNNFIMHPQDYTFRSGESSAESIGEFFSTLPAPVQFNGPSFYVHPSIQPYVVFRQ